jgi:hypothetical protein
LDTTSFADSSQAQRRRKFRRDEDRTEPYNPETAPPLVDDSVGGEAPIFEFAPPVIPPASEEEPPQPTQPGGPDVVINSIRALFDGTADFNDIFQLIIAGFAIFGGTQLGGSDNLFKLILSLFSGKANFRKILEERLAKEKKPRRRK